MKLPKYCAGCGAKLVEGRANSFDEMTGKPIKRMVCPEIEKITEDYIKHWNSLSYEVRAYSSTPDLIEICIMQHTDTGR